jgi:bis(5'-nucleosidyl)-tetraphosphatase
MKTEISSGAVIFRKEGGVIKYLLLRYPAICHRSGYDYWDFVKGHIDAGETELETIIREAQEETGLNDLQFVDGFGQKMEYFFAFEEKKIFKIVNFCLAKTMTEKIILSHEHNDFAWLPYQEAYVALSFDNAKKVLKAANDFLAN